MASENFALTLTDVKEEDMSKLNDIVDNAIKKWTPDHSVEYVDEVYYDIIDKKVDPHPPTRDQIINNLLMVPGLIEVIISTPGAFLSIIDKFTFISPQWDYEQSINLDVELLILNRLRELSIKAGYKKNYLEEHLAMRAKWYEILIWSSVGNGCICCDIPPSDMNEKGRFDYLEMLDTPVVQDGIVLTSPEMELWWKTIRPTLGLFLEESS